MARWQKAPRRKRRRRWLPRTLALLALIGAGYAGYRTLYYLQQRVEADPPANGAEPIHGQPVATTPELYGTPSGLVELGPGISARLVDRPDSNIPIVLVLPAPDDEMATWAGVQSTLEQFGVASLIVPGDAGTSALARAAEWVQAAGQRRSQPVGLLSAGTALEAATALGSGSSLADRPLVALSPPPQGQSPFQGLIARMPTWLRTRLASRNDDRLAEWRGRVLVVRARDDARFDAVAANRLVAGTRRGEVLVMPGKNVQHAPLHPDQESWRSIADFIRGVTLRPQEVVVPTLLPNDSTSTPPADTLRPPQP